MTAELQLPRMLSDSLGTDRIHVVAGTSVEEALLSLFLDEPGLRLHLLDDRGEIRPHVLVFVDGRQAHLGTAIGHGSRIRVLHAVSGGSAEIADTEVLLVKAPIGGRRHRMIVAPDGVVLEVPSVLRSPITIPREDVAAIVRLDRWSGEDSGVTLARDANWVFLTPNQYATPNYALVLGEPIPLRFRYGWSWSMGVSRAQRLGKEPIAVLGLAAVDSDGTALALQRVGFRVETDLVEVLSRVFGVERDPEVVGYVKEKELSKTRRGAWIQGGWFMVIGGLLMSRGVSDGELVWAEFAIGSAVMVGVYLATAALFATRRPSPTPTPGPVVETGNQQSAANRSMAITVLGILGLIGLGWLLVAVGIGLHWVVGVGSGLAGGYLTGSALPVIDR